MRALVIALVEVISGLRPIVQLSAHVHPRLTDDLAALIRTHTGARLRLASLHLQPVRPRVVEASLRVTDRSRSHAFAIRLVSAADRWGCVALESASVRRHVRGNS